MSFQDAEIRFLWLNQCVPLPHDGYDGKANLNLHAPMTTILMPNYLRESGSGGGGHRALGQMSKRAAPSLAEIRTQAQELGSSILADMEACGVEAVLGGGSKKTAKTMPVMQSTPHESDTPGWCSDPLYKLSAKSIAALDAGAGNDLNESDLLEYEPTRDLIDKKGATGDRTLIQYFEEVLNPADPDQVFDRVWLVEDAQVYGTKYGYAKFGKRLLAMHAAVKVIDPQANACPGFDSASHCDAGGDVVTVLLLGKDQPLCRANCIPALNKAGIVIQRRET